MQVFFWFKFEEGPTIEGLHNGPQKPRYAAAQHPWLRMVIIVSSIQSYFETITRTVQECKLLVISAFAV